MISCAICNKAGKSSFLGQNAIITILSQIGCFVPANSAHIGVIDRVFCRVGAAAIKSRNFLSTSTLTILGSCDIPDRAHAIYKLGLSRNKALFLNKNLQNYIISKLTICRWTPKEMSVSLKLIQLKLL